MDFIATIMLIKSTFILTIFFYKILDNCAIFVQLVVAKAYNKVKRKLIGKFILEKAKN